MEPCDLPLLSKLNAHMEGRPPVRDLHSDIPTFCAVMPRANRRTEMRKDVFEHVWDFLPKVAMPAGETERCVENARTRYGGYYARNEICARRTVRRVVVICSQRKVRCEREQQTVRNKSSSTGDKMIGRGRDGGLHEEEPPESTTHSLLFLLSSSIAAISTLGILKPTRTLSTPLHFDLASLVALKHGLARLSRGAQ
jgi:hypothetical protein